MDTQLETLMGAIAGRQARHNQGRYGRWKTSGVEGGFRCKYCHTYVHNLTVLSGVQNRNHCPFCLWSRHLDWKLAGDRLSACKATMQPIGLTVKRTRNRYSDALYGGLHTPPGEPLEITSGELMIIHRCSECGAISINRIAADDASDGLINLLCRSSDMDAHTLNRLANEGIHMLHCGDIALVERQLFGCVQH